jgi:amino acid transporter
MIPNLAIPVRTLFAWALDGILPSRFAQVSPRTHAPNYAIGLTVALSIVVLGWAVTNGEDFFSVLVEAFALQLVTMILLGVAGVLLPYRRPEAWRASATTRRFLGIPIIAIAGALTAALLAGIFYVYLHYPELGIEHGKFFRHCGYILGAALLTFFVARAVRLRQGVDVDKLAAEIPPE